MASAPRYKVSEKQAVVKKLMAALKKEYKGSPPKDARPVLETLLYAICLENASLEQADAAYERIFRDFFDLNEVRVSSITELCTVFVDMPDADLRSLRLRSALHFAFESNFEFELEGLKRKTLEQANKQLEQISDLSPFTRAYTLQQTIGSHLVPTDLVTQRVTDWLGLTEPAQSAEEAAEMLKSVIRKTEGVQFCFLVRHLATDAKMRDAFDPNKCPPDEETGGYDLTTAADRLKKLLAGGAAAVIAAPAKKASKTKKKTTPAKSSRKAAKSASAGAKKKTTKAAKKTTAAKQSAAKKTKSKQKTASRKRSASKT